MIDIVALIVALTSTIGGFIVAIISIFVVRWRRAQEESVAALAKLQDERATSCKELFNNIGFMCSPVKKGKRKQLTRNDIEQINNIADEKYNQHGAVLSPESRFWIVALRETSGNWLINRETDAAVNWEPNWKEKKATEMDRFWLTKTALRIALAESLQNPSINGYRDWMRKRRFKKHLVGNFLLVHQHRSNDGKRLDKGQRSILRDRVEDFLEEMTSL